MNDPEYTKTGNGEAPKTRLTGNLWGDRDPIDIGFPPNAPPLPPKTRMVSDLWGDQNPDANSDSDGRIILFFVAVLAAILAIAIAVFYDL